MAGLMPAPELHFPSAFVLSKPEKKKSAQAKEKKKERTKQKQKKTHLLVG
jgi:hypothetical protein